jgi:acyl-CoA synthetase (AMP-forming)/AMP-acid ligase II
MIIRGGENIYRAEIEQFLMRHPKIADAQVIGIPDAFMGEEMAALILLKPGDGYYKIQNRSTGTVLEVSGNSTSNGGRIDQWTCVNQTNEEWTVG